jgi:tetratricopeptide (TPR) repeat protein
MELTTEQSLQHGISAHRAGKLEEAEQFYRAVLQSQSAHPDANHNLGLIAVSINKAHVALPFFKTALEANPKIEQFWLSYINALIKEKQFKNAKHLLEQAEKEGFDGKKLHLLFSQKEIGRNNEEIDGLRDWLEPSNLKKSAVISVEEFYQDITERIVSEAAPGWLFADSFDRYFMEDNPHSVLHKKEDHVLQKENGFALTNEKDVLQFDSSQILKKLNNEKCIVKKYNYLKKLINSDDVNLVNDSFKEDTNIDLGQAIEKTFDRENLNLVVIGGGVCGLFIANSLKHCFGDRANVLVLENRSRCPNTRERFKRDWLTHIPTGFFKLRQLSNIQSLIEDFGSNGLIGIPINILETILQLSCKDQGVKFYFSETLDYSNLNDDVIDLVFDATGGRLMEDVYSASNATELSVKIPKDYINLKSAGINQLHNIPGVEAGYLDVVLKPCGDFHRPYIGNTKICIHMCKITGVPINLMETILELVEKDNSLNSFYVWKGCLKDEINEGLIILNLLGKECEFLTSRIDASIKLNNFLISEPNISHHLNKNIVSIIEMLALMDVDAQVSIESPFKYSPYVNINSASGSLHGKRVFPIGDSLFCGHPKMGNGLGSHLPLINELLERMNKHWTVR